MIENLGYAFSMGTIYSATDLTNEHNLTHFMLTCAKTVSLVFNRKPTDHVHCYHHTPKYDNAVVLYGTTYMPLLFKGTFTQNATYMLTHFISEHVGSRIRLDYNVLRAMVSSCAIHPFFPTYEEFKDLVQPSSILYAYISLHHYESIGDHGIRVLAKLCELSSEDLVNSHVPDRQTMLHYAVKKDSLELYEFLLD